MYYVEINPEKCTMCNQCLDGCPSGVFAPEESVMAVVNMQECVGCQACVELCAADAITLSEM